MERAGPFEVGAESVPPPFVVPDVLTVESPALQGKRLGLTLGRWLAAVFIGQMVFLAVAGASAYYLGLKLDRQRESAEVHGLESQSAAAQVTALTSQTEALKAEVINLRQSLISGSSEDVIFLKMIILKPNIDPELARTIAHSVHRNSELYGRDPNLVLAIMAVESDFNPKAMSSVGAEGLMQVMPHWKKVLAINGDLMDPDVSIRYGLQILGFYEEMYKDLNIALTAYNRGPGPVDTALMRGVSPNNGYAPRILVTYERLKTLNVKAGGGEVAGNVPFKGSRR
jgi:soluble lytic murein transglycosylase-like protein